MQSEWKQPLVMSGPQAGVLKVMTSLPPHASLRPSPVYSAWASKTLGHRQRLRNLKRIDIEAWQRLKVNYYNQQDFDVISTEIGLEDVVEKRLLKLLEWSRYVAPM